MKYAMIHVKPTTGADAWPVVERVPGGWSSGVFHYPDETVLDVQPLDEIEQLNAKLAQAAEALCAVGKAALVVKTTLDKPYRQEEPGLSPWTKFMERPARDAYNLGCELRAFVKKDSAS